MSKQNTKEVIETIKVSEAVNLTGLSTSAILRRIKSKNNQKGFLNRVEGLDLPGSKKRTIRLYKNEVLAMINSPIEQEEANPKTTKKPIINYPKFMGDEILDF